MSATLPTSTPKTPAYGAATVDADAPTLAERLEGQRIGMLTTLRSDGSMHSRPMTLLEVDAQGSCWFLLEHDPSDDQAYDRVGLTFSDPADADYLAISGQGELTQDRQRLDQLWTRMARPWFPDGPDSPRLAALCVRPERAESWDSPDSRVVRALAMAASVVASKPIGLGKHEVLDTHAAPSR